MSGRRTLKDKVISFLQTEQKLILFLNLECQLRDVGLFCVAIDDDSSVCVGFAHYAPVSVHQSLQLVTIEFYITLHLPGHIRAATASFYDFQSISGSKMLSVF